MQIGTGLCANDDVLTEGPLARFVGKERSDWLTHIHSVNFTLIEIAMALHVLAIITYRVLKGQNLLLPMMTGKKRLPGATRAPRMMHPILALVVYLRLRAGRRGVSAVRRLPPLGVSIRQSRRWRDDALACAPSTGTLMRRARSTCPPRTGLAGDFRS